MLTGEQIRAGRALLRLTQKQFAEMVHVPVWVLRRLEGVSGTISTHIGTIGVIETTLETAGVELIGAGQYYGEGGPGVRLKGELFVADTTVGPDSRDTSDGLEEATA